MTTPDDDLPVWLRDALALADFKACMQVVRRELRPRHAAGFGLGVAYVIV